MTNTSFFHKDGDNVYRTTITYPFSEWLENNPNTEYSIITDSSTDSSFDDFMNCLTIENGVLSYDLLALKKQIQQIRKNVRNQQFKIYDNIILQINGLAIPENRLGATHKELFAEAEAKRLIIWQDSENKKQEIIKANTVDEILKIWKNIIGENNGIS
jgi:hypothetical protein